MGIILILAPTPILMEFTMYGDRDVPQSAGRDVDTVTSAGEQIQNQFSIIQNQMVEISSTLGDIRGKLIGRTPLPSHPTDPQTKAKEPEGLLEHILFANQRLISELITVADSLRQLNHKI